jgi:hypothetical protein
MIQAKAEDRATFESINIYVMNNWDKSGDKSVRRLKESMVLCCFSFHIKIVNVRKNQTD